MTEPPTWGGKRAGAGRPPLSASPTVRATVTLPAPLAAHLRELGDGNLSRGVRRLYQAVLAASRSHSPPDGVDCTA